MTKGEQTRQRILEQAAPIFNQHGYEGSSINHLMAATGLKKGGIYRHFASKEELAAEAFDYMWDQAKRIRLKDVDSGAAAVDQLKRLIDNFVRSRLPFAGGCPVLNAAVDSDDGNALLRDRAKKAARDWIATMQAIIKKGVKHRELRKSTEPKTVATVILATLEGALMISRLERDPDALERAQRHLNQYLDSQVAAR